MEVVAIFLTNSAAVWNVNERFSNFNSSERFVSHLKHATGLLFGFTKTGGTMAFVAFNSATGKFVILVLRCEDDGDEALRLLSNDEADGIAFHVDCPSVGSANRGCCDRRIGHRADNSYIQENSICDGQSQHRN